ncbi:MAG: alpha/beta fold hydrolase [Gemmataceae bacterium]
MILPFTAGDGYEWRYRRYPPDGQPRGRILYLHGIQSHGGWYEASSRFLAREGYVVEFLDRRGSGLNGKDRGDAPSWERLVDDIAEFALLGPKPVVMAVSWGGKLAVALEMRYPGITRGLALLTPGIRAQVRPPLITRMRIGGAYLFAPRRTFPVPLDDPALFTANPDRQRYIREDALSLRRATARFLIQSVRLDWALSRASVRVPVLLMLAGEDRITDNAGTKRYADAHLAGEMTLIEYPGASHTLEFEPDPAPVFRDVAGWLNSLTSPGPPRPPAGR